MNTSNIIKKVMIDQSYLVAISFLGWNHMVRNRKCVIQATNQHYSALFRIALIGYFTAFSIPQPFSVWFHPYFLSFLIRSGINWFNKRIYNVLFETSNFDRSWFFLSYLIYLHIRLCLKILYLYTRDLYNAFFLYISVRAGCSIFFDKFYLLSK